MRVFVAGATGVLGRQLVPQLVAKGHDVTGMTRSESKRDLVRSLGARPAVADALDPDAVARAVAEAEPEVIVHELTALSGPFDLRHFDRFFAGTNRLRTEGTDHLLAAGRAVGAKRFVAQSYAGWGFARVDGMVKTEDDPLDPDPPKAARDGLAAIRHTEAAVSGIEWGEGVVLRYGSFYGPGTSLSSAPDADMSAAIRKRQFPVVGAGNGYMSFIHIEDAATATVAAVEHGERGIYNVVDDEPAPAREWMPVLANELHAKPPRHFPRWLARLFAGEAVTVMMTEARGASNAKAKRELGWQPRYASWRQGFARGARLRTVSLEADQFEELRPKAFAIAYRMLGSVSEAEDVVQEAFLRLHGAVQSGERIESPRAYLSTVVTRLGIDQLRSARARRETYVGEWLPEPVVTSPEEDPARQAEVADSLSLAFLVLLESLSPEQRAVFLLREVFDYPYERIAEIVGKSEDNVRQLAVRARRHVDEHRSRFEASREQRDELADRFLAAAQEGELAALEALLAEDVELHGDGGGKAPALARPVFGRDRVARTVHAWWKAGSRFGTTARRVDVNGQPGVLLLTPDGQIVSVLALDIADGQIQALRGIVNPDKLQHLGEVADVRALLRGGD